MPSPTKSTEPEGYMTPEQVADRFQIGKTRLYALLRSGQLRSVRIGRSRRIPIESVHDFEDSLSA